MNAGKAEYIPGVCNIGQTEIKKRLLAGKVGLVFAVVLAVALIAFKAEPAWRLLLFFPAMIAAIGYIQAAWHFCAAFGLGGVFNLSGGKNDTVEQAEYRRADQIKALKIIALATLIGAAAALIVYVIPV